MTDTIDGITLKLVIAGHGGLSIDDVSYATEEGYWLLGEQQVDQIINAWGALPGHEAQWVRSMWVMAFATKVAAGVQPEVVVGTWGEYEEDGEWNLDEFPFLHQLTVLTTPPPREPEVVPEERPSDAQFRHFGRAVAATLALWSEAEFDADEMIADIDTIAKQRLGIPLDLTNPAATPERFAMWKQLANAFNVEGPENDDE